jgi:hypothetical protein
MVTSVNLVNLKHGNQRAMALQHHILTALDAHGTRSKTRCHRCITKLYMKLTLDIPHKMPYKSSRKPTFQMILQAFDVITTNSSIEILSIDGDASGFLSFDCDDEEDRVRRALSLNTTLKDIRITTEYWLSDILDIVMVSPNLKALTMHRLEYEPPSIEDITDMVQLLLSNTKLQLLTIEGFQMDSGIAAAFAAAFQANQTIKTLIMRHGAIKPIGAVSFVNALPHDHSLEAIVFDELGFDYNFSLNIVRMPCHTPLKVLSLVPYYNKMTEHWSPIPHNNEITQDGGARIIQTLKEIENSFTKLDLFHDTQDAPWHNFIRLEIDLLTWENRLHVEKDKWIAGFLEQDAPAQELLFLAMERAKEVDNEQYSKAPNMLFYLMKESPDLIARAVHDGH